VTPYDAAIVGGGPAGAALASLLASAGRAVILFERERAAHDKVCGEFISHEGAYYLAKLGISIESLGGVPIRHVRLGRRGRALRAPLPFEARSLSRCALDEALLHRAVQTGAELRRGSRVKGLAQCGGEWRVDVEGAIPVRARNAFLATGKHDLKGWKRPPGRQADLIAFKVYWRLAPKEDAELAHHIELFLFPGGYAGLQPVEGGRANLCLLVRKSAFAANYRDWNGLIAGLQKFSPHLAARLHKAECLSGKPLAISGLPYGHLAREGAALWRLGDQAAVIPSFSGDGISIALHSAHLAARCYLRGESADVYQRKLASQIASQVGRATLLSRMLVTNSGQRLAIATAHGFRAALTLGAGFTRIPARAFCAASDPML
jgi:menaquinone-9 beta-reductase